MEKNKKIISVLSILFIALVLSLGITFAALSYQKTGGNETLVLGDIYMYYNETNELIIENAMPSETYDTSKYFEFKISGKNTYEKKSIFYEIKLNHGDDHDTRETRILDSLLKFTLVEIKDSTETVVVDGASYDNLVNQQIWVSVVPANTLTEIETTYRLYMWVSSDTKIGNTADANYDVETWNEDVFASVKVNVTGDFNQREIIGQDGRFAYVPLENGKIQISRYLDTNPALVIPAEYDGYEVYSVQNIRAVDAVGMRYNIFGETTTSNTTITSLVIEDGIEVIGVGAFHQASNMSGNLNLPDSIKEIGGFAFNGCKKLTGDLKLPVNLVKMGDAVFQQCSSFNGTLTMSPNLEVMGTSVFNHCTKLTNVTLDIPTTLRVLGRENGTATHAFYNLGEKTFAAFTINGSTNGESEYFKVIDGVLFDKNVTRLLSYPQNLVFYDEDGNPTRTYEIPEGVVRLDEMAFNRAGHPTYSAVGSTGLQKLVLPNSLIMNTDLPEVYLNEGSELAVALYAYTGVAEIAVKDDNPNYKTVDGILYSKDGTELWYVPMQKSGNIIIEDGTTTIKPGAFFTAGKITSLFISASVNAIEGDMFERMNYYLKNKMTIDANNETFEIVNGIIARK